MSASLSAVPIRGGKTWLKTLEALARHFGDIEGQYDEKQERTLFTKYLLRIFPWMEDHPGQSHLGAAIYEGVRSLTPEQCLSISWDPPYAPFRMNEAGEDWWIRYHGTQSHSLPLIRAQWLADGVGLRPSEGAAGGVDEPVICLTPRIGTARRYSWVLQLGQHHLSFVLACQWKRDTVKFQRFYEKFFAHGC